MLNDLRYAVRVLRNSPGFTLVAVIVLAIGIAANVTIFSLANAVLLKPLSRVESDRVVRVSAFGPDGRASAVSYRDYADYRERDGVFTHLSAANLATMVFEVRGSWTEQILGELVSANYFDLLKARVISGRAFQPSDDRAGADRVVIVGHRFWQQRFMSAPDAVGAAVVIDGEAFTVVGIAAPEVSGTFLGAPVDVWVPLMHAGARLGPDWTTNRGRAHFQLIGRLEPGVTETQARDALNVLSANIERAFPGTGRPARIEVVPGTLLAGCQRALATMFLGLLLALVALVLVVACANIANLLLGRALGRRREIAIRLSLGASRARIVRQLLAESLLLTLLGGAGGLLVAAWLSGLFSSISLLPTLTVRLDLAPDLRLVAFTIGICVLTACALGFGPAMQASRPDVLPALKDDEGSGGGGGSRLRNALVVLQVGVSAILLIGAALFLRSLSHARHIDIGIDPVNAFAVDLDLQPTGMSEPQGRAFYRSLLERVRALPGVTGTTLSNRAPVDSSTPVTGVIVDDRPLEPGRASTPVSFYLVGPDFFGTVRTPIVQGRGFTERDSEGAPAVVVINQTMAQAFWPGQNPIGRRFRTEARMDGDTVVEVVGVARNARYLTIGEEPQLHMYLPFLQRYQDSMTLIVRSESLPATLMPVVQRELRAMDSRVEGFFPRTLTDHLAVSLLPARLAALASGVVGAIALLLATIGVYGVIALAIAQRTHEIGIRVAVGAAPSDVLMLIVGTGLRLAGAGLAAGMAAAALLGRAAVGLLYGLSPTDPATYAGVALIIMLVSIAACYAPVRRAMRLDPLSALRRN